jgi:RNA polymerase sigma-70 factor (ECF subfamily)
VALKLKIDPRFEELYRSEYPAVFRAAFVLCRDGSAAEDAAQEAFAKALARWRRLRDEPWAAGWVMTTAMNVARRGLRRRPEIERRDPVPARDHEDEMDLWREISALPARQQEAVVLHYMGDLPISDVARAMGCQEGTVKAHLWRAREALRTRMEGVGDGRR